MEALGLGEVIGIGGVAIGAFYVMYKTRQEQAEITKRVIDVVEKNAATNSQLTTSIQENTRESKEHRDFLSQLLLESIKK